MRLLPSLLLLFALPLSALAGDDEGGTNGQSIDQLLNSIPEIASPKEEQLKKDAAEAARLKAAEDISFTDYAAMCTKAVMENWKPKKGSVKKDPKITARFSVKVEDDGSVGEIGAIALSGDKKFDQSAFNAIQATPKLPRPPPHLAASAESGIIIDFTGRAALAILQ